MDFDRAEAGCRGTRRREGLAHGATLQRTQRPSTAHSDKSSGARCKPFAWCWIQGRSRRDTKATRRPVVSCKQGHRDEPTGGLQESNGAYGVRRSRFKTRNQPTNEMRERAFFEPLLDQLGYDSATISRPVTNFQKRSPSVHAGRCGLNDTRFCVRCTMGSSRGYSSSSLRTFVSWRRNLA